MSKHVRQPYFFTPFRPDTNHPLFVFLPGMDETGKELMTLQVAGLESIFDIRCFVIPAEKFDNWESLSQRLIALTKAELEKHLDESTFVENHSELM